MASERVDAPLNPYQTFHAGEVTLKVLATDSFFGKKADFLNATAKAVEKTSQHIPLHALTLSLKNEPKKVISGYGHAGWTHSDKEILINVNPNVANLDFLLQTELPRSVSHELHHAAREKALPGEKPSLGERLVKEGLATIFEKEVWGGELSAWATALTQEQIFVLLDDVEQNWESVGYDHKRWFFGRGDLPKWTGYSIGVYLVEEYLKLHPDKSAASLVDLRSEEVLDQVLKAR